MGEQLNAKEKLKAVKKETRSFECPHCNKRFQFIVRVNVVTIKDAQTPEEYREKEGIVSTPTPKKDPLKPEERALVEEARAGGIFAPFVETAKNAAVVQPKDYEKYFLQFMRCAVRVKTPQFALRTCLPEGEQDGELELWTHTAVSAVLADGAFKMFLPTKLAKGEPVKVLSANGGRVSSAQAYGNVEQWVRTRNGYVVGRGLMFGALKKRAAGSFDTMNL